MVDEKEDPARKQRAYLEEWLARHDQQRALRPVVTQMLGTSTWSEESVKALRAESPSMARELEGDLWRSFNEIKTALPLPPKYEVQTTAFSTSAASVAVSTVLFQALASAQGGKRESTPKITLQIGKYSELVSSQGRDAEAGRRVALLFPDLEERFRAAHGAAFAAQTEQDKESAALQMRTFIDKLKGELWSKALKHAGEKMSWDLLAERLAPPIGREVLREQGATHSSLVNALSNIGKARSQAFDFDQTRARFVDHVYIVCGEVLAGAAPR